MYKHQNTFLNLFHTLIISITVLLFLPTLLLAESYNQSLSAEISANNTTMSLYSSASYALSHKNYQVALQKYDEMIINYPNSILGEYAKYCMLIGYKALGEKERFNLGIRDLITYTKQLIQHDKYQAIIPALKSKIAVDYMQLEQLTKADISEAKQYAQESLQGMKPDTPDVYLIWRTNRVLAQLYEKEGNLELAKQAYENTIKVMPDLGAKKMVQVDLAKVLIKMGKKDEAKKILDELNTNIKKESKLGKEIQEVLSQIK